METIMSSVNQHLSMDCSSASDFNSFGEIRGTMKQIQEHLMAEKID